MGKGKPLAQYDCLVATLLHPSTARAAQATLVPDKDNSIFQDAENSNGAGISLFSGHTDFNAARRALLRFDVAASIPGGATITSVRVTLACTQSPIGITTVHAFSLR